MSRPCETAWWQPGLPGTTTPDPFVAVKRGSAAPVWCLALFTAVLILSPQSWIPSLAPFRLALVTGVLAIGAYIADRARRGLPAFAPTRGMTIALMLFLWALVTVPFSSWPGGSFAFLLDPFLKTLVVLWLVVAIIDDRDRLRKICGGLFLMSLPIALTALQHFRTGVLLQQGSADAPRIAGFNAPLTGNPNDLALTLNLMLPLGIALLTRARTLAMRLGILVLLLIDVLAVVITFSRGGFLTLGTIALIALWKYRSHSGLLWGAVALGVILLMLAPVGYMAHMTTITDMASDVTGSAQERWLDMKAALVAFAHNPLFGAGIGMNVLALNEQRGDQWRLVHNVYLQYAVELGIPGLALFLALLVRSIHRAGVAGDAPDDPGRRTEIAVFGGALQTSLVAFGVAAMFHPVAYNAYFFYFAGLAESIPVVAGREGRGLAESIPAVVANERQVAG